MHHGFEEGVGGLGVDFVPVFNMYNLNITMRAGIATFSFINTSTRANIYSVKFGLPENTIQYLKGGIIIMGNKRKRGAFENVLRGVEFKNIF